MGNCPSGYETNGTHCLDTNEEALTSSSAFPVPFTIAAAVVIIACLMSKLQFSFTFLPGAIYSLLSVLEWGALVFFLFLYFRQLFTADTLPLYLGGGALAFLYILNLFGLIIQNLVFCSDKHFLSWHIACANKCFSTIANIIALVCNHKFRNILFCKLFTFGIFTAQLDSVAKFKVLNIFSFLSLIHSAGAILSASIALPNT